MTDLISRADAIEAVHKHFVDAFDDLPTETDEDGDVIYKDTKSANELLKHNKAISKALKALPSADAVSREFYEDAVKANIGLVIENRKFKEQIESADAVQGGDAEVRNDRTYINEPYMQQSRHDDGRMTMEEAISTIQDIVLLENLGEHYNKALRMAIEALQDKEDEPQFYTEDDYWNGMFAESAEAYKAWTGEEMGKTHGRLIDADALIERMPSVMDMQDTYLPIHFKEWLIDEAPTISADRPHGEWEDGKWCPICGCGIPTDVWGGGLSKEEAHYCVNCGAKMGGDGE